MPKSACVERMKTVAEENLTYSELLQILELIKSTSQFSEIHLKFGDIEIDLSRAAAQPSCGATAGMSPTAARPQSAASSAGVRRGVAQPPPVAASRRRPAPTPAWPANSVLVRSPMVGTFYRAPSPGSPPFVEVGQTVKADTTVCIIEVMKLMSSIPAGTQGTITYILAENGELVEHDQILMVIAPR
jgi:acetyl-CoA carboxylase biotin carboxyl carrier protein